MPGTDLVAWGVPRLSQLLPLDEESLTQIITYSASLSKDACAEHLKNLLGDSPAALEFISSFNSRRGGGETPPRESGSASPAAGGHDSNGRQTNEHRNVQKKNKRTKAPLHSAGPPRRPENYGNVTGGYMKSDKEELPQTTISASPNASSLISSQNPSPGPKSSTKAPPSAAGPLISDYLPNVKSRTAKSSRHTSSGTSTPGKQSITTGNIEDLTAAIAALEVSTNPTLSKEQRKCNCNASLHPLFTPAPNCLSCGKIICALEGLQPCSFCGAALISTEDIQSMIKELRAERGNEKMRAHNESLHHDGGPGPGPSSSKLEAAKAHRDKLLAFQAQNAQRTKVVDEAADFETPNVASTLWMSPAQRALALKKQQRILREMEEKARPEWERKKTVMSLDIKGGRVVRTYQSSPAESSKKEEQDAEEEELARAAAQETGDQATTSASGAAFGKNPLLAAGGLVRPVWKAPAGKEPVAHARKERTQTWRRVQDDNDDNEQWILDGGLHGYGTESEAT
ncbi:C2HC5 finger protein [Paecilomyces variotii]|uniref:C2HC5 finger protein n=1 Tax=Byssochlamys spectabilis TaxID=264951 RepID=A0A443HYH3_BYSSP|nr:C2HC5 finger protein [Paecilomyces variotii]RWQ96889.1 C2HC5 finger protein [Paecilomyces variotii]